MNLKELSLKVEKGLSSGHRTCSGCSLPIAVRIILYVANYLGYKVVACSSTGCLEVTTSIFPYTAWEISWIHSAFENAAATIAGVAAAYKARLNRGENLPVYKFIAFAGDGGTYDIGFQALSGAMERNDPIVYVCLDNQAYMNTGIQRSSATPHYASTTTSPAGKVILGKPQKRKDIVKCMVAHGISYAAQAGIANVADLMKKAEKALTQDSAAFLNILCPCQLGWGFPPENTIEIAKLAEDSLFWHLYEVENGKYKITYTPRKRRGIIDFLSKQRRFSHLFNPLKEDIIKEIEEEINLKWEELNNLCQLKGVL
jgi:pyruvate ferredoxin oxidoreductase beta subunit